MTGTLFGNLTPKAPEGIDPERHALALVRLARYVSTEGR